MACCCVAPLLCSFSWIPKSPLLFTAHFPILRNVGPPFQPQFPMFFLSGAVVKKKKKENLMGFVQILTEEVHLSELTEIKCKVVCIMSCQSAIQRPKASRVLKMTC